MTINKLAFLSLMLITGILVPAQGHGQGRTQARSMVISRHGIVASEHPLASRIGVEMLEHGGNAVDAAVAANAAMGLLAPMANGIGGDLFAIVYEAKTGKLYGLNASGWAPAGLTPDFLKAKGFTNMPQSGIHSVTVPGAVDGWDKLLRRFGRKRLSAVLAPKPGSRSPRFSRVIGRPANANSAGMTQPQSSTCQTAAVRVQARSLPTRNWPGVTGKSPAADEKHFMRAKSPNVFSPVPPATAGP